MTRVDMHPRHAPFCWQIHYYMPYLDNVPSLDSLVLQQHIGVGDDSKEDIVLEEMVVGTNSRLTNDGFLPTNVSDQGTAIPCSY